MSDTRDFPGLSFHLLSYARQIIPELLPGGRLIGNEWTCGNLNGGKGDSCKANIQTGRWSDFATDDRGNDLISLYAAVNQVTQSRAYDDLAEKHNFGPARTTTNELVHYKHGAPSMRWTYRDKDGNPLFFVARYDTPDGKQYAPWHYDNGRLVCKSYPEPRPLYNLDKLTANPEKPVLICEGEKACDAAENITNGVYCCTTWPHGAKAAHKADWSPVHGRSVLIWPDADSAGVRCADDLAQRLFPLCKQVKIINVSDHNNGWDAADALAEGFTWSSFKGWAKQRVTAISAAKDGNSVAVAAVSVTVNTEDQPPEPTASNFALWESLGVPLSGNGAPMISLDTGMRVLSGSDEFRGKIWIDTFYHRIFTSWGTGDVREWTDVETLNLCLKLQREYALARMTDKVVYDAVRVIANKNKRNEPRDFLESIEWDKKPRIRKFFCDYYGVTESEYCLSTSQNWWISMVARIYKPGCQVDNMVILKGPQGRFKSSSLRVIGGPWYANCGHNVLSKDFYQILQGKLIIEIGEMDSFARAEVNTIKDVISNPTDRFRAPYDRLPDDHPRQCVFVGTTNEDAVLKDHTGGRRFWPIDITYINLDDIARDRNQLFAEAAFLYKNETKWYEVPQEETERVQEDNRQHDEWEEYLHDYLKRTVITETTVFQIAEDCFGITIDKVDRRVQMRIGRCLKTIGWEKRIFWDGIKSRRKWCNKNADQQNIDWDD